MAPRPGASESQMVPIEEVEAARKAAEDCSAKREVLWSGIKSAAGACNTLSWKLFGIGLSISGIVMTGVLIYMSMVAGAASTKADEVAKVSDTKNEKQDERIRSIELQVVKEISEINVKMVDVQALMAALAAQKQQTKP